jgi:signal transduction histidine kinase
VHSAALERAFGRVLAAVTTLFTVEFWCTANTMRGERAGSAAVDVLVSLVLAVLAVTSLRRPPGQRQLDVTAAATAVLLAASWLLAVPGSPFLRNAAYLPVVPVAVAWAALSRRFVVPVPVALILLATGVWYPGAAAGAAQTTVTTLATTAFAAVAARLMRVGARQADAEADRLSRAIALQDAALAAEEAERRAANAVHDDVLSVLRAVSLADSSVPWHVLVTKAKRALAALASQVAEGLREQRGLGSALRRRALEAAADLDVRCDVAADAKAPAHVAEALCGAVGEALRNVAAHAGTRAATITARDDGADGVWVTVADQGIGFDPDHVRPAGSGLRNSIQARLRDVGGQAKVTSIPGRGTTVALAWHPAPAQRGGEADPDADPMAWGRRLAPRPSLIFLGFMLPQLLGSLALLILSWGELRWPAAGLAGYAGLFGLTALSARNVSRVRMTPLTAVGYAAAVAVLVELATLAVAAGTTDGYAYWVAGESGILIGVLFFLRGPAFGLSALALDLAALSAGLIAAGNAISSGGWVGILASPVLGGGLGVAFRIAFRSLSAYTERQLADYGLRLRRQARAEAMSRVDRTALEHARQLAGPVLSLVASGQPPSVALRAEAEMAGAVLRDELLAPGFLTADLAWRVRSARICGALVTVRSPRQHDAALTEAARQLLAATLGGGGGGGDDGDGAVADATLHVHPPAEGQPALLALHVRGRTGTSQAAVRACARRQGAVLSDLGDGELLIRLSAGTPAPAPVPAAS